MCIACRVTLPTAIVGVGVGVGARRAVADVPWRCGRRRWRDLIVAQTIYPTALRLDTLAGTPLLLLLLLLVCRQACWF